MKEKHYFIPFHTLFPVFSEDEMKIMAKKIEDMLEQHDFLYEEMEKLSQKEIREHLSNKSKFEPSKDLISLIENRLLNLYKLTEYKKGLQSMIQRNIDTLNGKIKVEEVSPDMNVIEAENNAKNRLEDEIKRYTQIWEKSTI